MTQTPGESACVLAGAPVDIHSVPAEIAAHFAGLCWAVSQGSPQCQQADVKRAATRMGKIQLVSMQNKQTPWLMIENLPEPLLKCVITLVYEELPMVQARGVKGGVRGLAGGEALAPSLASRRPGSRLLHIRATV